MNLSRLSFVIGDRIKFSTSACTRIRVAVLGASGGIGHPLSLLLKLSDVVTHLSLYDITHAYGDATDLSHINTASYTEGYDGKENLKKILNGTEVVVIPAGLPRKPGMSRDDLFQTNANATVELVEACAQHCPKALLAIITNPLNAVIPVAAEVLKKKGVYDPKRLFGVTTLDLVRGSTFCAKLKGVNPNSVYIPVIGGHSGKTIVPLISKVRPKMDFTEEEIVTLTKRIQTAGSEVVKAKGGSGSATLAMAYAAARFLFSICRGLSGDPRVIECSYVHSDLTEAKYFSSPLVLGQSGIEEYLPLPKLSKYESELLKTSVEELKKTIEKAEKYPSN